ncbi:hypothetical protein ACQPXM_13280 [Kribbella sp. CA-253562]|uniref:hypothetical protein n=1 Tax=Kribbella sp. CA-253562 TaxID=3239942 RepID=UPI003D8FAFCF
MQHAGTTPGLDPGTKAEVRVAQAWFWDGYYVRRGVDLQHKFGSEVSTVTDLDIVGFTFDASLKVHKHVGEVKTGKSNNTPKPLDRALWARGVRELVGAETAEITTAFKVSVSVRDLCRQLGATVQHLDDLTAREDRLAIKEVADVGAHGDTIASLRKAVHAFLKKDPVLERGYWFLVSEVWFLEPFDAVKRTLGLIRELGKTWPEEAHPEAMRAARWIFAESISIITLNLAMIAGRANTMDSATFRDLASAELAQGDVPYFAVAKLSERFDEYLSKVLARVEAPAEVRATAMGAFHPTTPDYAVPLIELISRLASEAASCAELPRQMDVIIFERLVRRRELGETLMDRLSVTRSTERLVKLIAAFLRGQAALPAAVDKVLTTKLTRWGSSLAPGETQPQLFDQPDADKAEGVAHGNN